MAILYDICEYGTGWLTCLYFSAG